MPSGRRRPRAGRRLLGALVFLVALFALLLAGAQAYAPRYADRAIAQTVERQIHRPATVTLTPGPIWQLLQGRIQRLQIFVQGPTFQGLRLRSAALDWRDGRVDLPLAVQGQLKLLSVGSVRLVGVVAASAVEQAVVSALRAYLPSNAATDLPRITITPQAITLRGQVNFGGVAIPYRVDGSLKVQDQGQELAFAARDLNGARVDFPAVPLFSARNLPAVEGVHLRIAGVRLLQGAIEFTLRNAP